VVNKVTEAVEVLQEAVIESKFDPIAILDAFKTFEKDKAKFDDLEEIIGSGQGGKYWQLQFVSDKKHLKKGARGGGYPFPLAAIQVITQSSDEVEVSLPSTTTMDGFPTVFSLVTWRPSSLSEATRSKEVCWPLCSTSLRSDLVQRR